MRKKRKTPARRQNAPPSSADRPSGLSLREYWALLQHAKAVGAPMPGESAKAAPDGTLRGSGSGDVFLPLSSGQSSMRSSGRSSQRSSQRSSRRSSGSSNGGGALGYGLDLVLPDTKAQRQVKDVMDILRELVEKDAARMKAAKKSRKTRKK